jgi:hypothetical protein
MKRQFDWISLACHVMALAKCQFGDWLMDGAGQHLPSKLRVTAKSKTVMMAL